MFQSSCDHHQGVFLKTCFLKEVAKVFFITCSRCGGMYVFAYVPYRTPSPHPCAPHAQPISFFSILSPAQY